MKLKKKIELNENKYTTYQNLWDTAKAVLKGKCIALNAFIRKEEKSQSNNLTSFLNYLENEGKRKSKASLKEEIIKDKKRGQWNSKSK